MKNAASLLIFLCATAACVFAGAIKTVVITDSDLTFSLDVPDHRHLRIYNFTQDGASSPRGVVIAGAATATPTPTPTSTPSPTPTCTPSCAPSPGCSAT